MKRLMTFFAVAAIALSGAFADDSAGWDFSATVDFAYYPKSDYIAGETHFAPLTGPWSGIEGRITGKANYTIPTPLGENWLLNSANLVLQGNLEISPISIMPGVEVKFTPLPFLVFSAGAKAGTGWNLGTIQGMAEFNGTDDFINITPFTAWFLKWFAQATFQFDTGAIWKGDWTHFQIMYSYQVYYEFLSTKDKGDVWLWQASNNKVNGLKNYQNLVLAYQMPLILSRVGVLAEWDGYYFSDSFTNPLYKGDFCQVSISPMAQLSFTEKDTLSILLGFSSRRSFAESHDKSNTETLLTYSGYEWFFNRLALSYTHTF
ncbi:MAG: hypothetical protein II547_08980 [Treponema sp.]|nr:hypothetical protein [Treponema sp.]